MQRLEESAAMRRCYTSAQWELIFGGNTPLSV